MSIEPEVPYRTNHDDLSDEDDWRDPTISSRPVVTPVRVSNVSSLIDVGQVDRYPSPASTPRPYDNATAITETMHSRNADDHWVLPVTIKPRDLLFSPRSRIDEIQKATGSYIEYNDNLNQVDIWGDEESIQKAKSYLDMLATQLMDQDTRTLRKTKKWSKPERELTEKEKRRAERKQAKEDAKKKYQGLPPVTQNYYGIFPLPDTKVPLLLLTGESEKFLAQIRSECSAYLWYEAQGNKFRVAAETEEAVVNACARIRNRYLRCCRDKPREITLRLVQQPRTSWLLSLRRLPPNFITYTYAPAEGVKQMLESQRLIEPVATGVITARPGNSNLIEFDEVSEQREELSEVAKQLDEQNRITIEETLVNGLESIRLNDWVIRMKIRFGQICLIDYPVGKGQFLSIDYVSQKMFRKQKFKSALAPCISKSQQGLKNLFEFLNDDPDTIEFSHNPQTSFAINAQQYAFAPPQRIPGQRDPPRGEKMNTLMHITFTPNGQRRLWSTMTEETDLIDINTLDLESHYSWDLRLQTAKRLPNNESNLPHEKFSQHLTISPSNRLVMVTSDDYTPHLVTQKTTWKYQWKKGYVIEICQDEVWDMAHIKRGDEALPVDLSPIPPHRSLFKVSLIKEAWVDRFAENLNLGVGEAPSWTLRDFLASPDETVESIMSVAREFSQILNSKVPLYWSNTEDSLV